MNKPQDTDKRLRDEVAALVKGRRLSEAIEALEGMLAPGSDTPLRDSLERLREDYARLSDYALDGVSDPTRATMYAGIAEGVLEVADRWLRRRRTADNPTLYYNTLRTLRALPEETIAQQTAACEELAGKLGLALLSGESRPIDRETGRPLRQRLEEAWTRVFNLVWVTHPLSVDDEEAIRRALQSERLSHDLKASLISALTLGELEWHDRRRLTLLMEAYGREDTEISIRALVGLLVSRMRHHGRPLTGRNAAQWAAMAELPGWNADVKIAAMQLISARDTMRITRKIQEELIPGLMKLRPDLQKLTERGGLIDPADMEENPEWQEMLHKSGLDDKLKELASLQEEGGDVMMASFSNLKHFPFFNEVANWFLPFNSDHTAVVESAGSRWGSFARMMEENDALCDSDKYSLACALRLVPDAQLEQFSRQFEAQAEAMAAERAAGTATARTDRETAARQYVRAMYRFFKLFRRKGEFADPFEEPLQPGQLPDFSGALDNAETLQLIAEFYFKREYWEEAVGMLRRLEELAGPDAVLSQKEGHALQQMGRIEEALEAYNRADMLSPDSVWTLRRIGACSRLTGRYEDALRAYTRLEELRPEEVAPALWRGIVLIEAGRPEEALKALFKAEFLDEKNPLRAVRPLAWALTLTGKYDRAEEYFNKIPAEKATASDRLNRAHMLLLRGEGRRALEAYVEAIAAMEFDAERFRREFEADRPLLEERGVETLMLDIMLDRTLSEARELGQHIPRP